MTTFSQTGWILVVASFLLGAGCTYGMTQFLSMVGDSTAVTSSSPISESLAEARNAANAVSLVPLLDGTVMDYFYEDGSGVHMEIADGMLKYEWIQGTRAGNGNEDLPYNSREIGDDVYLVSWLEASHPDYTSLIFDFRSNRMYSTGIFRFGTENQFTRFDQGRIENASLIERLGQ